MDDVLQDAKRSAVLAGRVCEAGCGRLCDDQGRPRDGGRIQDAGVVSEDAGRSTKGADDAIADRSTIKDFAAWPSGSFIKLHMLRWIHKGNNYHVA